MLTMRPEPRSSMWRPKTWQARSVPVRLVSTMDVPLLFGDVEGGRALGAPRAVDEDVDASEGAQDRAERVLERPPVGDVAGHPQRAPAQRGHVVRGRRHLLLAARGGHDVRARLGQAAREGAPDARCPARHHRHLARQVERAVGQGLLMPVWTVGLPDGTCVNVTRPRARPPACVTSCAPCRLPCGSRAGRRAGRGSGRPPPRRCRRPARARRRGA